MSLLLKARKNVADKGTKEAEMPLPFITIYVARSLKVSNMVFTEVLNDIDNEFDTPTITNGVDVDYKIEYHKEGERYNSIKLANSDAMIVYIDNGNALIGKGIYDQISYCKKANKPIIVAYRRKMDDKLCFYSSDHVTVENPQDYKNYALYTWNQSHIGAMTPLKAYLTLARDVVAKNREVLNGNWWSHLLPKTPLKAALKTSDKKLLLC